MERGTQLLPYAFQFAVGQAFGCGCRPPFSAFGHIHEPLAHGFIFSRRHFIDKTDEAASAVGKVVGIEAMALYQCEDLGRQGAYVFLKSGSLAVKESGGLLVAFFVHAAAVFLVGLFGEQLPDELRQLPLRVGGTLVEEGVLAEV